MEVMDLDDDVPPKTEASSPVAVPVMANSKEGAAGQPAKGRDMLSSSPKKANGSAEPSNSPIAPPLTSSTSLKRETAIANKRPSGSPAPSKKSGTSSPSPRPNLVLPTWADTFHSPPRSLVPPPPTSSLTKTLRFVSGVLFAGEESGKGKAKEGRFSHFGKVLPRAWDVSGTKLHPDVLGGCRKVVVIGIHGWFPGAPSRSICDGAFASDLLHPRRVCENCYWRGLLP
jgi:hypothetical protein